MWPFKKAKPKPKSPVEEELLNLIEKTKQNLLVWENKDYRTYDVNYNGLYLRLVAAIDYSALRVNGVLLADNGLVFKLRRAVEKQVEKRNKLEDIETQQNIVLSLKKAREN